MQNEYTPLPSTCVTKLYSAAGKYSPLPCFEWYWIWSIKCCGCSSRTPMAMPFASSWIFSSFSIAYTSRAEWPVAKITGPLYCEPSAHSTPTTSPSLSVSWVTNVPKWTSPPQSKIVWRIFSIIKGNLSLPMWGCASIRIFSDAPCWCKIPKILSTDPRFLLRVYNFPSLYAPAPPSPKL